MLKNLLDQNIIIEIFSIHIEKDKTSPLNSQQIGWTLMLATV